MWMTIAQNTLLYGSYVDYMLHADPSHHVISRQMVLHRQLKAISSEWYADEVNCFANVSFSLVQSSEEDWMQNLSRSITDDIQKGQVDWWWRAERVAIWMLLVALLLVVVPICQYSSAANEAWHWPKHPYCIAGNSKVTPCLANSRFLIQIKFQKPFLVLWHSAGSIRTRSHMWTRSHVKSPLYWLELCNLTRDCRGWCESSYSCPLKEFYQCIACKECWIGTIASWMNLSHIPEHQSEFSSVCMTAWDKQGLSQYACHQIQYYW